MRNLILSASSLVLAVVVSGCASHETTKFNSADSLASTSRYQTDRDSEQAGKAAFSWGDKYTAANLFLQANNANNSIMNRFNLATAYASIGKTAQAGDIYAALVIEGQYTRLNENSLHGDSSRTISFNVGEESAKRLTALEDMPGPTASIGESSEVGTGRTNEEARILDQNAEDARGIATNGAATRISRYVPKYPGMFRLQP